MDSHGHLTAPIWRARVAALPVLAAVALVGCGGVRALRLPSPDLSPRDVVEIQLRALQRCDEPAPNAGVWTAFQFASPANRRVTGPYGRFFRIVRAPENRVLLRSRTFSVRTVRETARLAEVLADVTGQEGERSGWFFELSKQTSGAFIDCWMTDSVTSRGARAD